VEVVTIKRQSPFSDVHQIAADMGVSAREVDDALIERWAREHQSDGGFTMLNLVCSVALHSAGQELVRRVESFAPGTEGFYYEHEGVRFRITIKRDICDVVLKAATCFQFENPNL
jgi:hypothetical protein